MERLVNAAVGINEERVRIPARGSHNGANRLLRVQFKGSQALTRVALPLIMISQRLP